jgi:hypothetical protein
LQSYNVIICLIWQNWKKIANSMKMIHSSLSKTIGKWSTGGLDYTKRENRNSIHQPTLEPEGWTSSKEKSAKLAIFWIKTPIAGSITAIKTYQWKNRALK